jgi:hypothetical protein
VPHGQKLALGGQSASPRIRPMRHRQRIEIVPWHSLQRLMKNAMVMAHGIDPRYRVEIVPKPPGSSGHPCVLYSKNEPHSRGTSPVMTMSRCPLMRPPLVMTVGTADVPQDPDRQSR